MAEPISIRPATAHDVTLLLRFIAELAEYEHLSHEMVADEALLRRWLFAEETATRAVIAEYDGEPAGFALYFLSFSTFLGRPGIYLEDLYVTPDKRNRGIGGSLLAYLANLCVERGYGRLEWSVLDWNESAIRFYERLGARPQSEWTMYRLTGEALENLGRDAGSGSD